MTLNVQFLTMVSMVIGGFYLGIAHDTYERFSSLWKKKQLVTYLFAIVFWLIQACLLFVLLYKVNHGELRIYIFLACLLGFSIYQVFAAKIYRQLLEGIITIITKIARGLFSMIRIVFLHPIFWLIRLLVTLLKMIGQVILSLVSFLLLPFRRLLEVIVRYLRKRIKKTFDKKSLLYSIIEFIYRKLRSLMSFLRR